VKSPLAAEIEGIVSSDEAWLSFAVIKTPEGKEAIAKASRCRF
jgi:general secretion pathway protein C